MNSEIKFLKLRHCEFCGVEVPENYHEDVSGRRVFCCSEQDCERELRALMKDEDEARCERAKEDGYSRY